jgi:hypothetical protein
LLTRKLVVPALVVTALSGAVPAQADTTSDTAVCNEAENSHRGGYVLTDGGPDDPAPPAFDRGEPMAIGAGAGVEHAAEVSPALHECELDEGVPSDT